MTKESKNFALKYISKYHKHKTKNFLVPLGIYSKTDEILKIYLHIDLSHRIQMIASAFFLPPICNVICSVLLVKAHLL